jgi:hypothetical protein
VEAGPDQRRDPEAIRDTLPRWAEASTWSPGSATGAGKWPDKHQGNAVICDRHRKGSVDLYRGAELKDMFTDVLDR